jgi:hypothetical protein
MDIEHRIEYPDYINRVHGCWLGKCIAGTLGGLPEGLPLSMDVQCYPPLIGPMLPTDDLDMQVCWLAVLEEKGIQFTSEDLAAQCPYAPDGYAAFKQHYLRGIRQTPETTSHPHPQENMEPPIRSEIWACIAPGNPELAAELAERDARMDHAGDCMYGKQFFSAAQALAFVEPDLDACLDGALAFVPGNSRLFQLIQDVRGRCGEGHDWQAVREKLLHQYDNSEGGGMFRHIGCSLLALLCGEYDFFKSMMIATNSGFDTERTCATTGAFLGIHHAATGLMNRYDFTDQAYSLAVAALRRSDRICDLAQDVARVGIIFMKINDKTLIIGGPKAPAVPGPE